MNLGEQIGLALLSVLLTILQSQTIHYLLEYVDYLVEGILAVLDGDIQSEAADYANKDDPDSLINVVADLLLNVVASILDYPIA